MKLEKLNPKKNPDNNHAKAEQAQTTSCQRVKHFCYRKRLPITIMTFGISAASRGQQNFNQEKNSDSMLTLDFNNTQPRCYVRERHRKRKEKGFRFIPTYVQAKVFVLQFCS